MNLVWTLKTLLYFICYLRYSFGVHFLFILKFNKKPKLNPYFVFAGGTSSSYDFPSALAAKNRDADATNPNLVANNIYHSIEDLNSRAEQEHLYDEINQQKGNNLRGNKK